MQILFIDYQSKNFRLEIFPWSCWKVPLLFQRPFFLNTAIWFWWRDVFRIFAVVENVSKWTSQTDLSSLHGLILIMLKLLSYTWEAENSILIYRDLFPLLLINCQRFFKWWPCPNWATCAAKITSLHGVKIKKVWSRPWLAGVSGLFIDMVDHFMKTKQICDVSAEFMKTFPLGFHFRCHNL